MDITPEEETFEQFQPWVQQRFGINDSISWAKIILLHSTDEETGFEMFVELWAEFLEQQRRITRENYERVVAQI